jgi:hypothetical protein
MHHLEAQAEPSHAVTVESSVYVIDGNAVLQSCTQLPENFEDLAMQIFSSLPKCETVHFVTDTYKTNSIKQLERDRRGKTPTYCIAGPRTKVPRDFKSFMLNADNKTQLIRLLLSEWQTSKYARILRGRHVYFVCEEKCVSLTSYEGVTVTVSPVEELHSDHEEADTRIVLHCLYAAQTALAETRVVVRSPDTDVLVVLLHYASSIGQPLFFDTGVGNKRRLVNVMEIASAIGPQICQALPAFHSFTGCDYTSAFVRRGKLRPFQLLKEHPEFVQLFSRLGDAACLEYTVMHQIERFVCHMYGKPAQCDTNKLRVEMFCSRYDVQSDNGKFTVPDGLDVSLLPPCQSSLVMHAKRANYVAHIWRNSHVAYPNIPTPEGYGWKCNAEGCLQIQWSEGDIMPQQLIDVLHTTTEEVCEVEEDDEIDNIIDVVFEDDVEC